MVTTLLQVTKLMNTMEKLRVSTNLVEKYGEHVKVQNDLYGNDVIVDWRPCAGESATESGLLFESITEDILKSNPDIRGITKRPDFYCHFGMKRKGDFECIHNDNVIHIECKQLGNAESHFDKLSHVFMNLISGCYGQNFWLVYDYNLNGKKSVLKKIDYLETRCEAIKRQVALQGITFEYLTLGKLQKI